ncbi:hypothetical protein FSP39_009803 [Pinctada imbricata]|uniref:Uncharacterized protein n=1 Tax=Pinctada imbricata TaxID=66713 RepID=A0AA88XN37_PINIB|nr:hypothetical protein FSP39_009803 [Pinctada imbricata]
MEDCSWEFNAPQYHDFRNHRDDDDVESYFDVDHENGIANEYPDPEPGGNDIWDQKSDQSVVGQKNKPDSPKGSSNQHNKGVNDEGVHTPTPGNRRLTRSMCATPVNDKGLPEATEPTPSGKVTEEKEEYHSAPGTPESTQSTAGREDTKAKPISKVPRNLCTDLDEWKRKRAGCKRVYPNGTKSQPIKPVTSIGDASKSTDQSSRSRAGERHERNNSTEKVSVKHTRSASLRRAHSIERLNQAQRGRTLGVKSPVNNELSHKNHRRSGSNVPIKRAESIEKLNTPRTRSQSLKRTHSTDSEENRTSKAARITRSASVRSLDTSAGQRPRSDSASSVRSNVSEGKSDGPTYKMPKLTIPSTPTFMK